MALITVERSSQSSPNESSVTSSESDEWSRSSSVDGFWASKNIAVFLPSHPQQRKRSTGKQPAKGLHKHLLKLVQLLRPQDHCTLAVELEAKSRKVARYLVIVTTCGREDTEENIAIGVEWERKTIRVPLVVPIYRDTLVKLTGDGGFTLTCGQMHYCFKPVSVQCMWAVIQKLHACIQEATNHNYYHGSFSHTWITYYLAHITSDREVLNEWNYTEELTTRADSPCFGHSSILGEDPIKQRIIRKLREILITVDIDSVTSREVRMRCEQEMNMELRNYRGFIDQQMLTIVGQLEKPSQIFDFLYLGSEWNASNLPELTANGVGYILNMTIEIDNFFPDTFHYYNVRVYDVPSTDLLKHWDDTYQFIKKAINANSKVLVHCKMGVSRSASTVMAFAMKEYRWSLKEAMAYCKERRECVNPNSGFVQQLRQYEGILGARHNSLWGEMATARRRTGIDSPSSFMMTRSVSPLISAVTAIEDNSSEERTSPMLHRKLQRAGTMPRGKHTPPLVLKAHLSQQESRPKSWCGVRMAADEMKMKEQHIAKYLSSIVPPSPTASDRLGGSFFSTTSTSEAVSTPLEETEPSAMFFAGDSECALLPISPPSKSPIRSPMRSSSESTCENSDAELPSPSILRVDCPAIDRMAVDDTLNAADGSVTTITPGNVIRQVLSYEALTPRSSTPPFMPFEKQTLESAVGDKVRPSSAGAVVSSTKESRETVNVEPTAKFVSKSPTERPLSLVLERVMDIESGKSMEFQPSSSMEPMQTDGAPAPESGNDLQFSAVASTTGNQATLSPVHCRVHDQVLGIESGQGFPTTVSHDKGGKFQGSSSSHSPTRSRSFSVVLSRHVHRSNRSARRSVSDMSDLSPAQIRRAMATEHARHGPQESRHRALALSSQHAKHLELPSRPPVKSTSADSFVTYIPTFASTDERPSFHSVLQRFRNMGQLKSAASVNSTES